MQLMVLFFVLICWFVNYAKIFDQSLKMKKTVKSKVYITSTKCYYNIFLQKRCNCICTRGYHNSCTIKLVQKTDAIDKAIGCKLYYSTNNT